MRYDQGASSWVHLEGCKVNKATAKALLVELEDGEELWLPRSQISEGEKYDAGDEDVTISISAWIAQQKGLIRE